MKPETKTFSVDMELKDGKEGKFRALVCAFNTPDKAGDIVVPTAFDDDLKRRRARKEFIPVAFNHEINDPMDLIGEVSPFDTQATSKGLIVSGELFIDEPRAAKVHSLLKRGTLTQWSFGCHIQSSRPRPGGGREYLTLALFEVSPVLLAKGNHTETIMVSRASSPGGSTPLTPEELLAPYRARLDVMRQRVTRHRNIGAV